MRDTLTAQRKRASRSWGEEPRRKTREKEFTMFIKSGLMHSDLLNNVHRPVWRATDSQTSSLLVQESWKLRKNKKKSHSLQLITDGAAWEARNTRKINKSSLEQHWWDSEDLRLVWDLRIPSVQVHVALNGESSFGWRRKVRHQLFNTVRPFDHGSRTRREHAAFSHNDTTGGSAPYLWLQSEVAMHRGPTQEQESTPGGSQTVQIFTFLKTVFPFLNCRFSR